MAAHYDIDDERKVVFSRAEGCVTGDVLREHQHRLLADPRFDPSYDQLWDFVGATEIDVPTAIVRHFAGARSFDPGARRAFVVASDLAYGLVRMFQTLHEDAPEELRIFRDRAEAEGWLGLR